MTSNQPLKYFLQSRSGDKPMSFQVVCPQNGTAVLKGLNRMVLQWVAQLLHQAYYQVLQLQQCRTIYTRNEYVYSPTAGYEYIMPVRIMM